MGIHEPFFLQIFPPSILEDKTRPTNYKFRFHFSSDYYFLTTYSEDITLHPIERTSCLRFRMLTDHTTNFTILEDIFYTTKDMSVTTGSWTSVNVTLDVVQPWINRFKIRIYNSSLDNVTLSPGACPPGTVGATITRTPRVFPCKQVVQNSVLW